MIISQITAMSKNRVIGINNTLPWHLPEDLQFFKNKTKGHIIIMGRKTFEALGKPLPGRFHIIITRQADYRYDSALEGQSQTPPVQIVHSFDEALSFAQTQLAQTHLPSWPDEVFVIGGGEIYKESLPKTDRIYLTIIDKEFEGDAYYPEIPSTFELTEQRAVSTDRIPFAFTTWQKKRDL